MQDTWKKISKYFVNSPGFSVKIPENADFQQEIFRFLPKKV